MILTIDTNLKTIRIDDLISFKELIDQLDILFPNKEWYEYKLNQSLGYPFINIPYQSYWDTVQPYNGGIFPPGSICYNSNNK